MLPLLATPALCLNHRATQPQPRQPQKRATHETLAVLMPVEAVTGLTFSDVSLGSKACVKSLYLGPLGGLQGLGTQ